MRFTRFLLILATLLIAYSVAVAAWIAWPWSVIALLAGLYWRRSDWWSSAYGTARWADAADLNRSGMLDADRGLILGRLETRPPILLDGARALFNPRLSSEEACSRFFQAWNRSAKTGMVRLSKAVHTAVFAPTGVGKGVSIVIPHLLTSQDSAVVIDFKGELGKETGEHRKKMGQKVVLLDPFGVVTKAGDKFNPIDWIDPDAQDAIDQCRDLAEALVLRTGEEKEPHWNDSAELFIAAFIALVVVYGEPGNRSLQTVRSLLSDPEKMASAIKVLCTSDKWDGMLARLGGQLKHFEGKELGSVLTTANRHLRFLDTPIIKANTETSSFDPAELAKGKMTVYLILPPDHMRAQSSLLRMWIGAMLRAVVKNGLQEANKVQFVLDEAASLGHMESLGDALDKFRGYGVRLIFMYQSVGQLTRCWPEGQDQTLLSNVTQVFFGVNDNQTAEYVSNRLGEKTISVESGGSSTGGSAQSANNNPHQSLSTSWNRNENWNQAGRKLLKPEEVMALDPRTAITFAPGVPPINTWLVRYYEENLAARPGEWASFWALLRGAAGATALFLMAIFLAILMTAGAASLTKGPSNQAQTRSW